MKDPLQTWGMPAGPCLTESSLLGLGGGCHSPCVWSRLEGQQSPATPSWQLAVHSLAMGQLIGLPDHQPGVPPDQIPSSPAFLFLRADLITLSHLSPRAPRHPEGDSGFTEFVLVDGTWVSLG